MTVICTENSLSSVQAKSEHDKDPLVKLWGVAEVLFGWMWVVFSTETDNLNPVRRARLQVYQREQVLFKHKKVCVYQKPHWLVLDYLPVESVPNEEKEHRHVIDVHLIEACDNKEKHHRVLNIDQKNK